MASSWCLIASHYSWRGTLAVVNNEMISSNCIEIRAKQVAALRFFCRWPYYDVFYEARPKSEKDYRQVIFPGLKCRFVAFKFAHYAQDGERVRLIECGAD